MKREAGGLVFVVVVGLGPEFGHAALKFLCQIFVVRICVEIVLLVGIDLQIVELKLFRRQKVVDEFVTLGAYSAAWLYIFPTGIFVILVEPVCAPMSDALAFHDGTRLSPFISAGIGIPATSRMVGARSRFRAILSEAPPAGIRAGYRTISGMRMEGSYIKRLS